MTNVYTDNLFQIATYWRPGASDGFGKPTYGLPISIACRWQDKQILFRDAQAREQVSDAIVYVSQPVAVGGLLILDIVLDEDPPPTAKEIRSFGSSPSLDDSQVLLKAIL